MLTTEQEVNMKKLASMIRGIKVAMLTTQGRDGVLHSRPMATQDVELDRILWFFTAAHSDKADEIRQHPRVNVSYVSAQDHFYVSLAGRAEIVRDREKMAELWSPAHRAWFPKGLDDPDLALLRVEVESAEHWDMLSSAMVRLVELHPEPQEELEARML
ncbi:General stress protein 26 [Aquisphaera giovannonii]|uniref:General stress protein 26 n=1 Tax=Aquisphaera giovannonii TaxID=406548 RepID=A0A5B9W613_9BACT|nr:pyridoxamine 5'-phosphate oxidase family protein [Aquisphaera giovannonii]QEH36116.1 General stress protein 26 [Aquisphaera giovannonii]